MRWWPWAVVPALGLPAACADPPAAGLEADVVDSAGVAVVTLQGALTDAPVLSAVPVWSHGLGAGEYEFRRILAGALVAPDSAVVADSGNGEVASVARDGSFVVSMPSGQGPGEALGPVAVRVADAASVWVDDDGNGRLVRLTRDGVGQVVTLQGRWDLSTALRLRGVDRRGRWLMSTSAYRTAEMQGPWLWAHLVRVNPDDLTADTVGRYRQSNAEAGVGANPFRAYGTATVDGDGWVEGWAGEAEVRWLDEAGAVSRILRWTPEPRYPEAADVARYEEWLREDLRRVNPGHGEEELDALIARSLRELEIDDQRPLPYFREIIGDDAGHIWIEHYDVATLPTARLSVVRAADGWTRQVEFPSPVTVLDIRGGLVLAAVYDAFDVQAVTVFRVDEVGERSGR